MVNKSREIWSSSKKFLNRFVFCLDTICWLYFIYAEKNFLLCARLCLGPATMTPSLVLPNIVDLGFSDKEAPLGRVERTIECGSMWTQPAQWSGHSHIHAHKHLHTPMHTHTHTHTPTHLRTHTNRSRGDSTTSCQLPVMRVCGRHSRISVLCCN